MNIEKILKYALEREHEDKRFFSENAAAQGAFKAIAEEEQCHNEA